MWDTLCVQLWDTDRHRDQAVCPAACPASSHPGEFLSSPVKPVSGPSFAFALLSSRWGEYPQIGRDICVAFQCILPVCAMLIYTPSMSASFFLMHECAGKLRLFSYSGYTEYCSVLSMLSILSRICPHLTFDTCCLKQWRMGIFPSPFMMTEF